MIKYWAFKSRLARLVPALFFVLIGLAVSVMALARFSIATLSDPRYEIAYDSLVQAADYFPQYAPLQARVASQLIENHWDNNAEYADSAETALYYANRAIALNPNSFEYYLLAGHAYEAKGEIGEARKALKHALDLAPNQTNVNWQYSNLLLRENRLAEALPLLRKVAAYSPSRVPAIFQMVWQVSGGDVVVLQEIAATSAQAQLELAHFFVQQKRFSEAVAIYRALDASWVLSRPDNAKPIDGLLKEKQWEAAQTLWHGVMSDQANATSPEIWNSSWELAIQKVWGQFDWQISPTKFAQIGVVKGEAHSGQSSLQVVYKKIDTVSLNENAKQLCVVSPSTRYRLTGYVKKDKLVTPDGPSWQVISADNGNLLGSSNAFGSGTSEWEPFSFEFTTQADTRAIWVGLRQTPQFKYTEPTSGTVWFDDLKLQPLP